MWLGVPPPLVLFSFSFPSFGIISNTFFLPPFFSLSIVDSFSFCLSSSFFFFCFWSCGLPFLLHFTFDDLLSFIQISFLRALSLLVLGYCYWCWCSRWLTCLVLFFLLFPLALIQ
ncbi:hypothetical protein BJ508DRAFT_57333 [Ascobolus immersus RN42]|uniref:Uncharacterized protein n=1 Tax=Ascobolus immersus RN42 TaxID=1160509 RepID=A0A3N4IQ29_ASCIM|nr:hypothetical protein BJ508DRAFT_57333 [Ascobolus immersus RN42]